LDKIISNILETIDKSIEGFQGAIPAIQKDLYDELQGYIKDLKIKDGKLLNSVDNLKAIGQIKARLKKLLTGKKYQMVLGEFVGSFEEIAKFNNEYFSTLNKQFKPKKTLSIIQQLAVDQTIEDLIGQGMVESIVGPITEILKANITTGGSYAKFNEQLRTHILNDENGPGSLERYTRQITTDAINQYHAQYHETIAQDLNLNWGRYVGSNLTTTREFCELLTAKDWVHRSELAKIIKGQIDGKQCRLSKTTGLPLGMIPGTNADNFKVNRGGYQCGHHFYWVTDSVVPLNILSKFKM